MNVISVDSAELALIVAGLELERAALVKSATLADEAGEVAEAELYRLRAERVTQLLRRI